MSEELDVKAVYLSPTGRRCRVYTDDTVTRPRQSEATLIYDRRDGAPASSAFGDGFVLSRANWHLLRRVP